MTSCSQEAGHDTCDELLLISLQTFYRQYTTVTINPSVSMADFQAFMSSEGVSLPAFPSVDSTSVAGVIATGSHVRCNVTKL